MNITAIIHLIFLLFMSAWFIYGLYLYNENRIMIKKIEKELETIRKKRYENCIITMDLDSNKMHCDGYNIEACLGKLEQNINMFKISNMDSIKHRVTLEAIY